ncbi:MAG: DUF342 domain-containing protein [Firmicutes bacterium]|nr:DUF342 domain-containing protein [Bacillota bacterium]
MESSTYELIIDDSRLEAKLLITPEFTGDEAELEKIISQAGIKFGIKREALVLALVQRGKFYRIAEGLPPKPGTDDRIYYKISQEDLTGEIIPQLDSDLRFSYQVPFVEKGQVIAVWEKGKDGESGKDITGKIIPPPKCRRFHVTCGKGTECTDGKTIVATISGRPRLVQSLNKYRFEVSEVYVHNEDLTVDMPHLKYEGDIVIRGNVMEGSSINATGNVDILGDVIGATIVSGKSVQIRGNLIQSTVQAGYNIKAAQEISELLQKITDHLAIIPSVLEQLKGQPKFQRIPPATLMEKVLALRYPDFNQDLKTLKQLFTETVKDTPEFSRLLDWENFVKKLSPQNWHQPNTIQELIVEGKDFQERLQDLDTIQANIVCNYTLNSQLTAAQNILVKGQGSLHSQLTAGDSIVVTGIVRGGILKAKNEISLNKVGSEAGAATTLQVDNKGKIEIAIAYENTLFIVGKNKLQLKSTLHNSRIKLDQDARISTQPR